VFLPIVKDVVTVVGSVVGRFAEWSKENNNLETSLKMIAAIGFSVMIAGIVKNIGFAIESVIALKTAIMALNTTALFGPTGVIVALGLLTAALIGVGNSAYQAKIKDIEKEFADLIDTAKLTSEQIYKVQDALIMAEKFGSTFDESRESVAQMAEDLGISEENVIAIGLASAKVTEEYKSTLVQIQEYNKLLKEIEGSRQWC
jgi:hypothetical protein